MALRSGIAPRCSRISAWASTRSPWPARTARPPRRPCSPARSMRWAPTPPSLSAASCAPTAPTPTPAPATITSSRRTSPTSRSRICLPRRCSSPTSRPTTSTTTRTLMRSTTSSTTSWALFPKMASSWHAAMSPMWSKSPAPRAVVCTRTASTRGATCASPPTSLTASAAATRRSCPTARRSRAPSSRTPAVTTS